MTTVQLVAKNHVSMIKSDSMFVCCFTSHRDSFFSIESHMALGSWAMSLRPTDF